MSFHQLDRPDLSFTGASSIQGSHASSLLRCDRPPHALLKIDEAGVHGAHGEALSHHLHRHHPQRQTRPHIHRQF